MTVARLLLMLIIACPASGQIDVSRLIAPGSVVALRNPAHGDVVRVDGNGNVTGKDVMPAHLPNGGLVQIKKVSLNGPKLEVEGERLLAIGQDLSQTLGTQVKVKLVIDVGPSPKDEHVVKVLLNTFLNSKEVEASLHDYYVEIADSKIAPRGSVVGRFKDGRDVYSVGGEVSVAKPKFTPDPESRDLYKQSFVVLKAIVNESGQVEILQVDKSSGTSFDGKALAAVMRWHFEPAKKKGVPVAVAVKVELNATPPSFPR
jgi:TonB family protein